MSCLTPSGSRTTSHCTTVAVPASGGSTPARMRMMVVLPAPSGPTMPKISPGEASKLRWSIARTPGKSLTRSRTTTVLSSTTVAALHGRAELNRRVRVHPGLQFVTGIFNVDLDSVDERHPFLVGLDALGRELGLGRNERDLPRIRLVGVGVGVHRRGLAPSDATEIGFCHVRAQPDVIEVGQRDDGRARLHHFAELGLTRENDARERRAQSRVAKHDLCELEIFAGVADVGLGDRDILLRATLHRQVPLHRGVRLLEGSLGVVALVAGDNLFIPKFLTAGVVEVSLSKVGVIVGNRRMRGLELLYRRRKLLFLHS